MPSNDRSYNEKRDFIRMKINTPVSVTHAGVQYQATCKDLSGAGMLIETQHLFNLGDILDVSIASQLDSHLPFNATTEVSRVDAGNEDTHIIGLSIKEIR
ncbi:MAG: PilZ domain-containing protein [Spongiibacteraceae bacterium]|jgi:hypothetical protein